MDLQKAIIESYNEASIINEAILIDTGSSRYYAIMKNTNFTALLSIYRVSYIYLASLILWIGIVYGHSSHDGHVLTEQGESLPLIEAEIVPELPDVMLTTHEGDHIRFQDLLDDRLSIINFIYTSCTNVCPLTTANFLQLRQLMGSRDFQMISISIDPKRDNPARLRSFMQAQGATFPQWTFLTGSPRAITPLLGGFGFYNVAVDDHSPGVVIWDGRRNQWTRLVSLPPPHTLRKELEKFFSG